MANLVALDESSINLAYTRLYGRAKSHERIKEGVIDARFERTSILPQYGSTGSSARLSLREL